MSFMNELVCLVLAYDASGDPEHLLELEGVLKEVMEDLRFKPLPDRDVFRDFVNNTITEFTEEDGKLVATCAKEMWPELGDIDPVQVQFLKQGLIKGDLMLDYRYLKEFLTIGTQRLSQLWSSAADEGDIARQALNTTKLVLDPLQSVPAIVTEVQSSPLHALTQRFKEIRAAGESFNTALKLQAGDVLQAATMQDLWTRFADHPITDDPQLHFTHAVRALVARLKYREGGNLDMVGVILQILGRKSSGEQVLSSD